MCTPAAAALAHDPEAFPEATRATALDMSMHGRYRLMRPEIVGEPVRLYSNFIRGIRSLPVMIRD